MLNWKLEPILWNYGPNWQIYKQDNKFAGGNDMALLNLKTLQQEFDSLDCWTESMDDLILQIKLFENREMIGKSFV